eukprot:scaffold178152_cov19-Tisochrysis_lutea.AAC.1
MHKNAATHFTGLTIQDPHCEMCSDLWADIGMQSEHGDGGTQPSSQTGSLMDHVSDKAVLPPEGASSMTPWPARCCSVYQFQQLHAALLDCTPGKHGVLYAGWYCACCRA